jgi:hypothetical protein
MSLTLLASLLLLAFPPAPAVPDVVTPLLFLAVLLASMLLLASLLLLVWCPFVLKANIFNYRASFSNEATIGLSDIRLKPNTF